MESLEIYYIRSLHESYDVVKENSYGKDGLTPVNSAKNLMWGVEVDCFKLSLVGAALHSAAVDLVSVPHITLNTKRGAHWFVFVLYCSWLHCS